MKNPLATVIVLCYNHARFVEEAILSVCQQTYKNTELIVIDDASVDESRTIIHRLAKEYNFRFIQNDQNVGNCIAFNRALHHASGKYIVDLAADDILLPLRVETGVKVLENLPETYGVHFSDVALIDKKKPRIITHYKRDENGRLIEPVPQGWVFRDLVERYFISTPSMMIKKRVLDELGGYDETLTYEDFDFWIRSSRKYQYAFSDEVLVQKRIVKNSLSGKQRKFFNRHLSSTKKICDKIFHLCKNTEELEALIKRITYEMKWALLTVNLALFFSFLRLKIKALRRIKTG